MRTNWRPLMAGGKKLAIRISLYSINYVKVQISVPCRNGQYIILDCGNDSFSFSYYRGKCVISWIQNTSQLHSISDLMHDISIWFRYSYAVRLDDPEDPYTISELYKTL